MFTEVNIFSVGTYHFSVQLSVRIMLKISFLSRVSTLTRDIDLAILSVRLSVREAPVSHENGLT